MTRVDTAKYRAMLFERYFRWIDRGKCFNGSKNTLHFYQASIHDQREAAKFCFDCPVRLDCAEYACITETTGVLRNGVWGGLTEAERNTLMKRMLGEGKSMDALAKDGGAAFRERLASYIHKLTQRAAA